LALQVFSYFCEKERFMRKIYNSIVIVLVSLLVFSSCSNNPYVRDVSKQDVSLRFHEFHTDILNLSENFTSQKSDSLSKLLGPFYETYNTRILKLGYSHNPNYRDKLNSFLHETWIQELYESINTTIPNIENVKSELEQAFKYYNYYFPNKNIPQVATFVAGVQYSVVIDEDMLAIGLDKYLGEDYLMYKQMEIASFLRQSMYKEKIPVDCMLAIAENDFPQDFKEQNLLSKMIYHGRHMYFVKSMLPEVADTIIWGYSQKQLEFCEKSEADFWAYMVSADGILFKTEQLLIQNFIGEAPFTKAFDRQSPGRVGRWLGFKIVESFMKNNPDYDLNKLFAIEDAQVIMNKAKYNP